MEPDYTLIDAVESGDRETVATWLELNPAILQQQEWAVRLLSSAIGQDQVAALQLLLELGLDSNYHLRGGTLLHLATSGNHTESVRLLLSKGADASIKDDDGLPPLYYAALRSMDEDVISLLIEKTVPIDLNTAVALGNIDVIQNLLLRSADGVRQAPQPTKLLKDAIWLQNNSALYLHAGMPRQTSARPASEIVRLLLKYGANPNQGWENHLSPLFEALSASNFSPEIVDLLLKNGADITQRGSQGESAWEYAKLTSSPRAVELVEQERHRLGIQPN